MKDGWIMNNMSAEDKFLINQAWVRAALLNAGARWTDKDADLLDKVKSASSYVFDENISSKLSLIERTLTEAKESNSMWRAVKHFFAMHLGKLQGNQRELCVLGSRKDIAETILALDKESDPKKRELLLEKLEYLNLSKKAQVEKIAMLKFEIRLAIDKLYGRQTVDLEEDIIVPETKLEFLQGREINREEIQDQLNSLCTKKRLYSNLRLNENSEEKRAREIYQLRGTINSPNRGSSPEEKREENILEVLEYRELPKEQQNLVRKNLLEVLGSTLYQFSCAHQELSKKNMDKDEITKLNDKISQLNNKIYELKEKLKMLGFKLSKEEIDELESNAKEVAVKLSEEAAEKEKLNKNLEAIIPILHEVAASKSGYSSGREAFFWKTETGEYVSVLDVASDAKARSALYLKEIEVLIEKAHELHTIDRDKYIELMTYIKIISEGRAEGGSTSHKRRLEENMSNLVKQQRALLEIQGDLDLIKTEIKKIGDDKNKILALKKTSNDLQERKDECLRGIIRIELEQEALLEHLDSRYLEEKVTSFNQMTEDVQELVRKSEGYVKKEQENYAREYGYQRDIYRKLLERKRSFEARKGQVQ